MKETEHGGSHLHKLHERLLSEAPNTRKDCRSWTTFTIDPLDAKDFDDALSIKKLDEERFEIGIHIADVASYVLPESELDERAQKKATSIYYANTVDPMLPEVLSNDLCSLKPNVDRLAFSVIVIMNKDGKIAERWFGRTIIHSKKRFTYENAWENLQKPGSELHEELTWMWEIAQKLGVKRRNAGSIDFAAREIKCIFDEKGQLKDIVRKQPLPTHKLVEEYMLLANVEVAKFIAQTKSKTGQQYPVLFRLHDKPDPEKLSAVIEMARAFGIKVPPPDKVTPTYVQKLLKSFDAHEAKGLLHSATLRSMAKAEYGPGAAGHFGLAFKEYAHFTSPIRRYPDVIVHRLLDAALKQQPSPYSVKELKYLGEHCTLKEIDAAVAERESLKKFQVQWMNNHLGEIREGLISGVTNFGIFLEDAKTGTDGLVHITKLPSDRYEFKERAHSLVGKKKTFRLGDPVTFKVNKVDTNRNLVDYLLVEKE